MTPKALETLCSEAAVLGGEVLKERWCQTRTISFKGDINLVTDADTASEKVILDYLRERCPNDSVLAEESGATGGNGPTARRWYIDPLDGTTNYAGGIPHFAVNVAVADAEGMAAAATLDPLRGELFLAARGEGATLNGRRIQCSSQSELIQSVLATGFAVDIHFDHEHPLKLFAAYLRRSRALRRFGAAALDLAWVACGRFEGFWEQKLNPWDIAAGLLLVREAGGVVSDFSGQPEVLTRGEIMAGSRAIHRQLMEVMRNPNF
ncbi:MAG TPA: inositol monophosphatase family protein [Myxococcaceae bacterium]|nr:inositol monophosphatase family protein [Myxococcaceae bacterium]